MRSGFIANCDLSKSVFDKVLDSYFWPPLLYRLIMQLTSPIILSDYAYILFDALHA